MSVSPSIAIVILNWNGKKYLEQFLPAIRSRLQPGQRIIVADNGSSDDSVSFMKGTYPEIMLIILDKNHGFAKGYNLALQQVEADYYIILNSDVEVTDNWTGPIIDLMERDRSIAACQPKLLSWSHKHLFEYAGGAGGWLDAYGYPFARGRVFDISEEDKGQYDSTIPVFWASGAALFIRAKVFHEMGGFDPYFFAHMEEIDLCWRIQLAGYKVYACPASVVYHVGGGTLPRGNSLKTYLNFRNNRIMLSKNLPFSKKLWVMPVRLALDLVSALKGLLGGDAGYFVAVLRAQAAFLKWWCFKQDQSLFPASRKGKPEGMINKNMAWQHFAKKKRYFTEIVDETK